MDRIIWCEILNVNLFDLSFRAFLLGSQWHTFVRLASLSIAKAQKRKCPLSWRASRQGRFRRRAYRAGKLGRCAIDVNICQQARCTVLTCFLCVSMSSFDKSGFVIFRHVANRGSIQRSAQPTSPAVRYLLRTVPCPPQFEAQCWRRRVRGIDHCASICPRTGIACRHAALHRMSDRAGASAVGAASTGRPSRTEPTCAAYAQSLANGQPRRGAACRY